MTRQGLYECKGQEKPLYTVRTVELNEYLHVLIMIKTSIPYHLVNKCS